ncbi:MAG TPA: hypothetical protein VNO24_19810 [Blastocatellia bacterium]|nr:hypothetical protein [Blastocatellia bacterium]
MNKLAIAFVALAFVTISTISQASNPQPALPKCNLTEATAPTVRGLRLGMSTQQLLALFPGSSKRKEMKEAVEKAKAATGNEAAYLVFDPATEGDAKQFGGVESVSAGVNKGRVIDFSIQYGGATWRDVDEWVAKLSESLKLQGAGDWTVGPSENPNKVLRCEGIEIEAAIQGGGSSIRIRNMEDVKVVADRNAADEKKRREIKP